MAPLCRRQLLLNTVVSKVASWRQMDAAGIFDYPPLSATQFETLRYASIAARCQTFDQGGVQLRNCKTANKNNIDMQVLIIAERLSTRCAATLLRQLREDGDVAVRSTHVHRSITTTNVAIHNITDT